MQRISLILLLPFFPACVGVKSMNEKAIKQVEAGKLEVARASWWGFDPEDSTKALQSAIDSGAEKVIVENMGSPWIVDKIQLASDQEVFFEKGVVVQAKRGAFKGKGDSLFTAWLKKNVTLNGYGATFRMWKEDYQGKDYEKAEWRMALSIRSCTDIRVLGLTLASSGGDGIYLGVAEKGITNKDVHIKDVVCVDNHRQGISVISAENLLIENTILKDTWGTAPQAGIDFEPNDASEKLVNIVMRGCVSENNRGVANAFYIPTLNGSSSDVSIRLENCQARGCLQGVNLTTGNSEHAAVKGRIEFVNCSFDGSEHAGIVIRSKPAAGCKVRFENCQISNVAAKHPEESPISWMAGYGDEEPIGGAEFLNCTVKDPVERRPMSFMSGAEGAPLAEITGTLAVERDGHRTEHRLDQKLLDEWMPHPVFKLLKRFNTKGVRYEPIVPDAKPEHFGKSVARQRVHAEYLLWAEEGQRVSFTVLLQPVGPGKPRPTPVRVLSPLGKETQMPDAQGEAQNPYSFSAEETGAHKILCEPGGSTSQVNSTTHRVCQYSDSSSIHFLGTEGTFFFFVPEGLAEFAVKVAGDNPAERVKAALHDPAGKLVEEKDDIAQAHQFLVSRPNAASGEIWSLRLDKPSHGVLEDFRVHFQGVPPLLAPTREALLKPVK